MLPVCSAYSIFTRLVDVLPLCTAFAALAVSRADVSDKDKPGQENAEDRFFVKTVTGGKVTDSAKQVRKELLASYIRCWHDGCMDEDGCLLVLAPSVVE